MPKYHVTKAQNIREYTFVDFEAPDDSTALLLVEHGNINWDKEEEVKNSRDTPDAIDLVYMLDKLPEHDGATGYVVSDQITVNDMKPYSQDAIEFTKMVARLTVPNDVESAVPGVDAVKAMNNLIEKAKLICG